MSNNFFPGEWVSVKSSGEMREFLMRKNPLCGWNDDMFSLCGKQFRIISVKEHEGGQIVTGLDTYWTISSDMIKYVDESHPVSTSRRDLPMFATEAGPVYDDARVRAMLDGTTVRYSDEPKACAPELTLAEPEKKKSRIVFSKIR